MVIQTEHIYIAPAHSSIVIENNHLFLMDSVNDSQSIHYPIDFFLRSLAKNNGERCGCVILSGMGSDGTLGLMAIKEQNGLTTVQEPNSAEHDSMPSSAIKNGFVDYIELPKNLPNIFQAFFSKIPRYAKPDAFYSLSAPTSQLQKILIMLRERIGCDFSQYKKQTIVRRIDKRMAINQIETIEHYLEFLHDKPQEVHSLFKDLLIGVTSFFRDEVFFQTLTAEVLPELFANHKKDKPIRICVAGCSTGEEAYSLVIILLEHMRLHSIHMDVQVIATDINDAAIQTARRGWYTGNIAIDVSKEYLDNYFTKKNNGYIIKSIVREKVIFARQNVIQDSSFSHMDIVSCRNLMIYFELDIQNKLLPIFHYALNPMGYLFLGPSESIGRDADLYRTINKKWKIYQAINKKSKSVPIVPKITIETYPSTLDAKIEPNVKNSSSSPTLNNVSPSLKSQLDSILLAHYTPACVLINKDYEICYIHGRTGQYLEPAIGVANLNILKMARHGLKDELLLGIKEATSHNKCALSKQREISLERFKCLTTREYDILHFLVLNLSSKAIAKSLNISPNTVDLHRSKIMKKLQVKNLVDIVNLAWCAGIVDQSHYTY